MIVPMVMAIILSKELLRWVLVVLVLLYIVPYHIECNLRDVVWYGMYGTVSGRSHSALGACNALGKIQRHVKHPLP